MYVKKDNILRGWLSPQGIFIECDMEHFTHYDFCMELFKQKYGANKALKLLCSLDDIDDQTIGRLGYVKIQNFDWEKYGHSVCLSNWFSPKKEITKEQYDWLAQNKPRTLDAYMSWFYK